MTIDPWFTLLVGAFGAALLSLVGGFVGAWLQSRREHTRWIREQRMVAYQQYLRVTEMVWPAQSTEQAVWRAFMDDMGSTLSLVRIVGPDKVALAGEAHLDAVIDFGSLQRKVNGVDDGKPQPSLKPALAEQGARTQATRDAFVAAARQHTKIKD